MTIKVKQLANNEFEISFVPQVSVLRLPVSEPVELELNPSRKATMSAEKIAVDKLREFLAGVERRTSTECIEHLKAGGLPVETINLGRVRRNAGASNRLRDGKCWWVLEPQVETRAAVAGF